MADSSPRAEGPAQTRVAIIGTGLAGLTTAYLLQNDSRNRYSVTLFEQVSSRDSVRQHSIGIDNFRPAHYPLTAHLSL